MNRNLYLVGLIALMTTSVFTSSCSKDDEGVEPEVGTIMNISFMESEAGTWVTWSDYEGAASYMVSYNGIDASALPLTNTGYRVSELPDGANVLVEAFSDANAAVLIAKGDSIYEKIVVEKPAAVTALEVVTIGETYVDLSWTNPDSEFNWIEIYNGAKLDDQSNLLASTMDNSYSDLKVTDLTPGEEYDFYVYVRSIGAGFSDPASIQATTIDPDAGGGGEFSLLGTAWEHEAEGSWDMYLKITFDANELKYTYREGEKNYYGLVYTFDYTTKTGTLDVGGAFESDCSVSADGATLTYAGLSFVKVWGK